MTGAVRRTKADEDIRRAIEGFLLAAPEAALVFADSLGQACGHIRRDPGSGSPRYAHDLGLPGLKFWPCKPFPYLVFYMAIPKRVEIFRVLHAHRDIPPSLLDEVPEQAGVMIFPE
ncbi:MAG: type II toxin-antitoxin system RelE/ParE family toxin [Betaproteobacteria bacterium]|nr:type II toxin-antitoxin system RelE/ParE family toxin [Betaproteobacteria bacterium]